MAANHELTAYYPAVLRRYLEIVFEKTFQFRYIFMSLLQNYRVNAELNGIRRNVSVKEVQLVTIVVLYVM